jgi:gamma-tubulin complex component 3
MQKYLTLSNFLIRLKRVEHTLSFSWQRQVKARTLHQLVCALSFLLFLCSSNSVPGQTSVRPVLHHCHLLRAEMIQFINTLQYYVMFEVLETSWLVRPQYPYLPPSTSISQPVP